MESWAWIYHGIMGGTIIAYGLYLRLRVSIRPQLMIRLGLLFTGLMLLTPLKLAPDSVFSMMRLCCWGIFVYGVIWLSLTATLVRHTARRLARICAFSALLLVVIGVDVFFI